MKVVRYFLIVLSVVVAVSNINISKAQIIPLQTVRGHITQAVTQYEIPFAQVVLTKNDSFYLGTITNSEGNFEINNVPVGRYKIIISSAGYKSLFLENIQTTSAKQMVLNLSLEELEVQLKEVKITTDKKSGEAANEMAYISARQFSIDETNRYAGSRGDPARMASNYAGVQGADDSRNDIVIRGNSPTSVLWRMEGMDIPNPNHFAIPGTNGGSVSLLNNKTLASSDFYTGAFPAEYGNSNAGVFDLKLRNGNNKKHEQSFQFGILGTELMLEGPLCKKKRATYLVTYRYATLNIFQKIGLKIGTDAVPKYQDAAFKINIPLKNNQNISVFGVGGISAIDILISNQKTPAANIYGSNDRDQYFESNVAWLGATYSKTITKNTYFKATIGSSYQEQNVYHELVYRRLSNVDGATLFKVDSLQPILGYNFRQNIKSLTASITHQINPKTSLKFGVTTNIYNFKFIDSTRQIIDSVANDYNQFYYRWNTVKTKPILQLQPYIQFKYKATEQLIFHAGWHLHYYSLSKQINVLEPRMGAVYQLTKSDAIAAGVGFHSQIQAPYLSYYIDKNDSLADINRHIGMSKSRHVVLNYTHYFGNRMMLKTETYYYTLNQVPVTQRPSSFSLANTGVGFSRFFPKALINKGKGHNYGFEATFEHYFQKGWYYLITGSLYESKYLASDQVWRDTDFNGNFILNGIIAKEIIIKSRSYLNIGGKTTCMGGRRYSPADGEQTNIQKEIVEIDSLKNSLQLPNYFRVDLRVAYTINRPKVTHEIAVDLVNILNTKNVLKLTYSPDNATVNNNIRFDYQLGFLPLFYYKIDF